MALLAPWAGDDPPYELLDDLVDRRTSVVAEDGPGMARLWGYRDRVTEAIARRGVPHKLDVTLPARRLAEFTARLEEVGGNRFVFGHLGDGNLHVNLLGFANDDESIDDRVLGLVAAHGGSISAEHGIGRAKQRWLPLARDEVERETFRRIKVAFDPAGIMNPGVLVDL
ncbi:MAG: FAD-linked oxidase C-terminal domain-containing protein [Ilumatobacteraceae bacterium]